MRADGPTLEAARDLIREARAKGPVTASVRIHGTLLLEKPFVLSAQDGGTAEAPVVYSGASGNPARLLGARAVHLARLVDEAVLARLRPEARGKVAVADLKAQGLTDYGQLTARGFGRPFGTSAMELFWAADESAEARPMTIARWPNDDYIRIAAIPEGTKDRFTYSEDRPSTWLDTGDLWTHGYWTWDWADSFVKVAKLDPASKTVIAAEPHGVYGYKANARFYFLNVLEEIDQPGEYVIDRAAGRLYFWPPEPLENGRAMVSVADGLLKLDNVAHVRFEGVTLEGCRSTAVSISGGQDNRLVGCTIRNVGTLGIDIVGGEGHEVRSCTLRHLGDNGINAAGGDRATLTPGKHSIVNNEIDHFSRTVFTYRSGVHISGVGLRMAHNLIHDAPHNAIGLAGNEHVIEYNEVHHVCTDTDDAGAFYMGRDWTWRGNIIRYNYWHDIGRPKMHVGTMSIYLDDWASGTTIYGNLVVRGGRGILIGGGRNNTVENNVFVDCSPAVHVDSRGLGWAKSYFDSRDNTLVERMKAVNATAPPYSTRYPELVTLYQDEPALAKYNRILRNICSGGRWLDLADGLTDKIVHFEGNVIEADPGFVDAAKGDYRLKPDSPALKAGFKPLPIEKMGRQADERTKP